jgi:CHAD domain-containing protein
MAPGHRPDSAGNGLRSILRIHFDAAFEAAGRLETGGEALHDLRVALRHLRVWLDAIDSELSGKGWRKAGRRARKLMRWTGRGRDDQALADWIRLFAESAPPRERVGTARLIEALDTSGSAVSRDRTLKKLRRVGAGLAFAWREAPTYSVPGSFEEAVARFSRAAAATLAQALERAAAGAEPGAVHEARIAGKRLRYLLEPIARIDGEASEIVSVLRSLQDLTGELHDLNTLVRRLPKLGGRVCGRWAESVLRRSGRFGLDAGALANHRFHDPFLGALFVSQRGTGRIRTLTGRFMREWEAGRRAAFFAKIETLLARWSLPARSQRAGDAVKNAEIPFFPPEGSPFPFDERTGSA